VTVLGMVIVARSVQIDRHERDEIGAVLATIGRSSLEPTNQWYAVGKITGFKLVEAGPVNSMSLEIGCDCKLFARAGSE
jgi:hypothetical protein